MEKKEGTTRKCLRVVLASTIVLALVMPAVAFADVTTSERLEGKKLTIETVYTSDVTPQKPQKEISYNGKDYSLIASEVVDDSTYIPETKAFSYDTPAITLTAAETANAEAYFPTAYEISEGTLVGSIPLVSTNSQVQYASYSQQVDRSYTIASGLPSNDIEVLRSLGYEYLEFETLSDAYYGATTIQPLAIAAVEYFVVNTDFDGIPIEYGANIVYRGQERYLQEDYYLVSAHYEGTLQSSISRSIQKDIYEEVEVIPATAVPAARQAPVNNEIVETEASVPSFPYWALVAGGAAVTIIVILIWYFRRVKLVEISIDGKEVVRARIRPITSANIPDRIQVPSAVKILHSRFKLIVPKRYSKRAGTVNVAGETAVYYSGPWKNNISLSFIEETAVWVEKEQEDEERQPQGAIGAEQYSY